MVKDITDYDEMVKNGEWVNRFCNYNSYGKNTKCEYCRMSEIYKIHSNKFCGIKREGSAKITPLPIHYVDNIAVHRDYTSSNGLPPSVKRPNIGRRVYLQQV